MTGRESAAIVSTEGSCSVIAVEQSVVHTGDDTVELCLAEACLRSVNLRTVTQIVLLQTLISVMICAYCTMCRSLCLTCEAAQSLYVMLTEVAIVGGCIFLLPNVCLTITCTANTLCGEP